ncbi:MAG: flagellar filament capping protein FliD [Nitrospinae bacterium]|nr:flagellar filament capping protein FliD [Nitrospinota bacterium]
MAEVGGISFGGLITGLDTKTIISELMRIARLPVQRLEQQRSLEENKRAALQELHTKLLALRMAAKKLLTVTDFFARTTTVSDETKLAASVTNAAQTGTYAITISTLAKAGQETFMGVSEQTAQDLTGTFTLQNAATNPTSFTISIDTAGMNLQQLRDAINSHPSNNGKVTATILDTGAGANRYVLQVKANAPGTQQDVDVTATASLTKDTNPNVTFAAVDARFSVDGVSFTRSTSTVSDVISGVTLTLQGETTAAVTLTVSNDTAAMQTHIKAFVSAYNDALTYVEQKSTLDQRNLQNSGPFFGDGTVRGVNSRLRQLITGTVAGLAGDYDALHDLGITTSSDGKLAIDDTKLSSALAANVDSVSKIFIGSGGVSGVAARVDSELANTTNPVGGVIDIRVDGIQGRVTVLTARIAVLERRLTTYEGTLRQQFSALERLAGALQSQGSALTGMASLRTTAGRMP